MLVFRRPCTLQRGNWRVEILNDCRRGITRFERRGIDEGFERGTRLTTRLNGVQVQHASVSELIFDIPFLVAYLSGITPLEPGPEKRRSGDALSVLHKRPDGRWTLVRDANMLVAEPPE